MIKYKFNRIKLREQPNFSELVQKLKYSGLKLWLFIYEGNVEVNTKNFGTWIQITKPSSIIDAIKNGVVDLEEQGYIEKITECTYTWYQSLTEKEEWRELKEKEEVDEEIARYEYYDKFKHKRREEWREGQVVEK